MKIGNCRVLGSLNNVWQKIYSNTIGNGNLLTNGNFELWTAGASAAPDGWATEGIGVASAREATIIKLGTYSYKLSNTGAAVDANQYVHTEKGIAYWKNRTITFGCWVYATVANRVYINMDDGLTSYDSAFHTGDSTWQWLTVTMPIGASATHLFIALRINIGAATSAYFDGAICMEGTSVPQTSNSNIYNYCLNGDTDVEYMLKIKQVGGAAGSWNKLTFNSDTGANYGYQCLRGENTTIGANRATTSAVIIGSHNAFAAGEIGLFEYLIYAKSGFVRTVLSKSAVGIATTTVNELNMIGQSWNNTVDNLTDIKVDGDAVNGLGIGTQIELFRRIS